MLRLMTSRPAIAGARQPMRARGPAAVRAGIPPQFDERPKDPIPEHVQEISAQLMKDMREKIKEALNAEVVMVKDAYGDGQHVSIDVISKEFEGKTSVKRQQMVYKAIWFELLEKVHAVDQMTTKTPEEAGLV